MESIVKSFIGPIIAALIAAVMTFVGIYLTYERRLSTLEGKITILEKTISETNKGNSPVPVIPITNDKDALVKAVKSQQKKYVKDSYGEAAGQNFSQKDLGVFIKNNTAKKSVQELIDNEVLIEIIEGLKGISAVERTSILDSASHTYKKTWGKIDKISIEGQTVAGQSAEKAIADEIVNFIKTNLNKTTSEIKKIKIY